MSAFTMRGILLALTVALVEPSFSGSKTYRYKYEGVILTGLPEKGLARAGLKVHCKVEISEVAQKTYLLKILNPEIQEYNGIWPKAPFYPASKLTQALASQLTQPIKFQYRNGQNGIAGICEASYVIQEDRKANQIIVTKSKDLNNCDEKIKMDIGMAYSHTCSNCRKIRKNSRGTAAYTYILKPTDAGTLIIQATSQEVHQLTPFNEMTGAAITEARQKLVLEDAKLVHITVPEQELKNRGSIQYQFASEILQTPIQLFKTRSPETQIKEVLQQLVQNNQQQVQSDAPSKFLQLTQLLRACTHENIEGIWRQYEKTQQYRRWILDTLPAAATPTTFRFISQRIMKRDLTDGEAIQTLVTAMHLVQTNHQIMQMAAELVFDRANLKCPVLRKHAVLAYGSMVNRYCAETLNCREEALKPLHDFANDAISTAHEEETVLALKALGNAGQPSSIKRIQKCLPGFSSGASQLPVKIQADAVMALRNIAKKEPGKVQELTMQLFMDRQLHSEVRMVASMVLLETRPPMALVAMLAEALLKETSLQVASFTYSHMKALTRSTAPENHALSAACNVAVKLLSHPLMAGAAANIHIINNAASILPSAVVMKFQAYILTATADPLEIGLHTEGLQEALMQNQEHMDQVPSDGKIQQIMKMLSGWKSVPSEKTLASAYIKLFGQEISFSRLDKKTIQEVLQAVREPVERQTVIKRVVNQLERGAAAQLSKPLLVAEVRRILPTCIGLPMEMSLYVSAVTTADINVQAHITPSPTNDFNVAQLLNSNIVLHTDVTPSIAMHTIAVMGINTHVIQTGVELHAKARTTVPMKFTAKIDLKENNFKIESEPCQQETEVMSLSAQAFAVSRNVEDLDAAKKTPLLPEEAMRDILSEQFNSGAEDSNERERAGKFARPSAETMSQELMNSGEHQSRRGSHATRSACAKAKNFGFEVCFEGKSKNVAFLRDSPLYKIIGQHNCKIALKPSHSSGATVEKIELELQTGNKAASKITRVVAMHGLAEADEMKGNILKKLNKLLTVDGETQIQKNPEIFEYRFRSHRDMAKFLGDSTPPIFAFVARAVRSDGLQQGYQVAAYTDNRVSRPRVQLLATEISEKSRWQVCADAILPSNYKAMAIMRWGEECQDYKVAVSAVTGRLASHPSLQIKAQWSRIPQAAKKTQKILAEYVPGAAFMLGFSQKEQRNPSKQFKIILAVTSPNTIDAVIKAPKITLFKQAVQIPVQIPMEPSDAERRSSGLASIMNEIPFLIEEATKTKCVAQENKFITFDDVKFSYQMPGGCYHILAQDCRSKVRFMVMLKQASMSKNLRAVNAKIYNKDIDILPTTKGSVRLLINNNEIPLSQLPFTDSSGAIHIKRADEGVSVSAQQCGLDYLYFDGKTVQVKVTSEMRGKTCGLCGQNDGERRKEFHMPDGRQAKSPNSFAHSWVVPGKNCNGGCKLLRNHVELGKTVFLAGEQSKCYSTEPVLKCAAGCLPTETAPVTVGFHCLPAGTVINAGDYGSFAEKNEDMEETVVAHTQCSCQADQCTDM
ncbi:Vitellogenin [Acipenser ruthenus]|uniref:Vitellogenin n=1 Tax=Acipenser ruthenus TaxID=7906 RepID=A0A662YPA3_ACIRT|nr:Vitellogenin [Acipenser ruthenus]